MLAKIWDKVNLYVLCDSRLKGMCLGNQISYAFQKNIFSNKADKIY